MEKGSKAPLSAVKGFLGEENGDLSCLLERNHNLFLREIVAVWESYEAVSFRLLCPFFLRRTSLATWCNYEHFPDARLI